ncbi:hypothetical protein BJY00DRAFT_118721 [Aspergillus carlsbadensis]|nr:hypothetical protein BJY00DRAFT_118721 [Aspergillus carlsbadensis]
MLPTTPPISDTSQNDLEAARWYKIFCSRCIASRLLTPSTTNVRSVDPTLSQANLRYLLRRTTYQFLNFRSSATRKDHARFLSFVPCSNQVFCFSGAPAPLFQILRDGSVPFWSR